MEKKIDYKKDFKDLYLPKKIEIIQVPAMQFFTVNGEGNPNGEEFSEVVAALYSLSYAIKMSPKKGTAPKNYFNYTVFPLEGVWDLAVDARNFKKLDKNKLIYDLMIRQPDFVNTSYANQIIEQTKKNKPSPALDRAKFETIKEGLCVQMMHLGSYDDEPVSFNMMDEFCRQNKYERIEHKHREIYLSDPRTTSPEKLKTVLRYKVKLITT